MRRIAVFIFFCAIGWGQHQHPAGATGEKPVALLPGLGIWSHPIATRVPEAQKFFDQGLVLLYGFNRYEALRSFRKVLELDPHAAMAQWGIAMALGPYINMDLDTMNLADACAASAAGLKIIGISATDRAWLEAVQSRCPDYADPARYAASMKALAARLPDDPDAQTWYAESLLIPTRWRWYTAQGQAADGVVEAEHTLESVLRRFPNHPGANHLYIHAVESSPTPERAIPSAQRLMGIVPAAGHIVHMPGHIWLALGDYGVAAEVNERAVQVDREYFAKTGVMSSYYGYYVHNLQFIVYARAMQGRAADTRKALAEIRTAGAQMAEMAGMVDAFATMIELRLNAWDDLLAAPKPAAPDPVAQSLWRFARAVSMTAKGRLADAASERAEFEKLRSALDRKMPWGSNPVGEVMDLAAATLDARMETQSAAAVARWRHAVDLQDALAYDEPPAWYYPLRESLGAALLRAGDAPTAESVFREGLRRSPRNGRMLFGLLESLKAQGKQDAAAWVEREFQAEWKGSDMKLRIAEF